MSGFATLGFGDYLTRRLLPNSPLSVYGARSSLIRASSSS